ncbi:hypothetical protein, partial [Acinetobacter gyllenbergii]
YYAVINANYSYRRENDSTSPSNFNRKFFIVGDGSSVSITNEICKQEDQAMWVSYGFLEFYDQSINSKNLSLLCFGGPQKYQQSDDISLVSRGAFVAFGSGGD